MTDENTAQAPLSNEGAIAPEAPTERRSLSIDEAVAVLKQSRQDQAQPQEKATDEPDAETPEVTEEAEDPEVETPEDAATDDQPDEEAEAEAEPQEDEDADKDGEDLYQIGDETFTLAELQEWKKGAMRNADYTRKTQALAKDREVFAKEREAFDSERQQLHQTVQQQKAQLQDALATFAIQQPQPPKRQDYATTDEYIQAQEAYQATAQKKQQAQQAYQALQQQQKQEVAQVEVSKALNYFPEWGTDEGFKAAMEGMTKTVEPLGITADEVMQAGLSDHRMFRVLNRLVELEGMVGDRDAKRKAAAKQVQKATKRLTPGAKPAENQTQKEARRARERLKKTGGVDDAVALLKARRRKG